MADFIQLVTTLPNRDQAMTIAVALVQQRLAACVQVAGPVSSVYHWQGQIQTDEEWVCTAKTRGDWFAKLSDAIRKLHPYDVPEIIATPLVHVSPAYADWLQQTLADA
jgi:periplasmic divalent cation tolerance protein